MQENLEEGESTSGLMHFYAGSKDSMLSEILTLNVFSYLLVFARVGSAIMFFPGIASNMVNTRIRLLLAVAVTLVMTPVVSPLLPPLPASRLALFILVFGETTIGIFLGVIAQIMMSALNFAGNIMSYQVGLASALTNDPVMEQQSGILANFLTNLGVVMVFVSGLYVILFHAIADSYYVLMPGQVVPAEDFASTVSRSVADAVRVGLQLAIPVQVSGLVFFSGLGVLSRLMPNLQIFFIAMPIQILMGLSVLMIVLPALMLAFLRFFEDHLSPFLISGM